MTVGVRVRDPNSGALKLDLADYTVAVFSSTLMQISGNGAINVPGINENDYGVFIVPCFSYGYFNGNGGGTAAIIASNTAVLTRAWISGTTVNWTVGVGHVTGYYNIMVVRYR